jgi:hypothetical protein
MVPAMQTFVVRVYRPNRGPEELRGIVDEVASGVSATFRDGSELLGILGRGVNSAEGTRGGPEE